jgi:hypothetical protein
VSILATTTVSLATSPFPPLALGFMGLGTGYLIYGPQELFGWPRRDPSVDFGTGVWGIWLPGLMQLVAGLYLFAGLTLFGTFHTKLLYMAALAFTSYGIHWFGIGWNRIIGADVRTGTGMTVGFALLSVLGILAFFHGHDQPVGGLFVGLTGIYVSDFFVSLGPDAPKLAHWGLRCLGFLHLGTGLWLLYLMFATVLNFVNGYSLPL